MWLPNCCVGYVTLTAMNCVENDGCSYSMRVYGVDV